MNLRTKYEIDEDNRMKSNIKYIFDDKNWFQVIKDIAPKTKSQLIQLHDYQLSPQILLDLENRNISFCKHVVEIDKSFELSKLADLLIGYYAYEACKFTTELNTITGPGVKIKSKFNFLECGFKYGLDNVSCLPIICCNCQSITIKNKSTKPLKIILLLVLLEDSFRKKILGFDENFNQLYEPEFQGKGRTFIYDQHHRFRIK
jgi:hypothetical protein